MKISSRLFSSCVGIVFLVGCAASQPPPAASGGATPAAGGQTTEHGTGKGGGAGPGPQGGAVGNKDAKPGQ